MRKCAYGDSMKSSLPEPKPLEKAAALRGPRPDWLIILAAMETAVTLAMLVETHTPAALLLSACWLSVLYCLWLGRNWARVVVIMSSVLTVLNCPILFTDISTATLLIHVVNTATSIGWLYMLSQRETVAFTKGTAAAPQ